MIRRTSKHAAQPRRTRGPHGKKSASRDGARPPAPGKLRQQLQTLEREIESYRHRLNIFRQASLGLTLDLSLDQALNGIVSTAADFFGAEAVSCMLWDAAHENLVLRAGCGFSQDYIERQRIPYRSIFRHIESGRDYLVIPDLRRSPFGLPDLILKENLVSVLAVAMRTGSQMLGALNIYSRGNGRNFTLEEIENAHLFAQQAAIAVINVQLLSELKEKVQIANTLLKVAEDIGSLDTLDEVLNRIVTTIMRILNFEVCAVFLKDETNGFYMPAKAVGVPPHRSPFFHTLVLRSGDMEFDQHEQRQRVVISSLAHPGRFPVEKLSGVLGHKDLYVVPLVIKDKLLGFLLAGGHRGATPFDAKGEMFLRGIAAQAAIAIHDANLFGELEQAFWDTIKSLAAAIEAKDHYTRDHSEAVIQYGTAIARELDLSPKDIDLVRKACLLHDVGKIGIEDEILRKVSPLTQEEWKAIERHPVIGEEILSSVRHLSEVSLIVRHHHEHFDGTGYPDHLNGDDIPLLARILQIADSFDAMTSDRPYRKALSREQAMAELQKYAGTQFDPKLVELFLRVLKRVDMRNQSTWS